MRTSEFITPAADASRAGGSTRARQGGFSLLEVTISMVILGVVGLGAAGLFNYSIRYSAVASARAQTLTVAQQQLEQLQSVPFDDALLAPTADPANPPRQRIHSGGSHFVVSRTVVGQNSVTVGGVTRPTTKLITLDVTPVIDDAPWAAGTVTISARRATPLRGPY